MAETIAPKPFRRPLASGIAFTFLLSSAALLGCGSSGSDNGSGGANGGSSSAGTSGKSSGGSGGSSGGSASGGTSNGNGATGGTDGNSEAGAPAVNQVPDNVSFIDSVTVDTLAGGSMAGEVDGDRDTALFTNPVSIARMDDGSFAVADYDSSRIRMVDADGNVSSLPAPDGFSQPYGLANVAGTLYSATDRNSAGAKSPDSGTVWSVVGADGTMAPFAENVGRPRALTAANDTTIAIADYVHDVVALIDAQTGAVTDLAGSRDQAGFADGSGTDALFDAPAGIVVRSDGNFVVSDSGNRRVRLVSPAGDVSTLAGEGSSGSVDGPGDGASFVRPRALAIDADDNVYVSDDGAHRIRRIAPDGTVLTVAGAGGAENGFQDGSGAEALFAGQEGLALSEDGKILYVADGNGGVEDTTELDFHRIRRVYLP